MNALLKDIKTSVRGLVRQPVFALIVIGILAGGIATLTTVFALVQGTYLRQPQFFEPSRLMVVSERRGQAAAVTGVSPAEFEAWHQRSSTLDAQVTAYFAETLTLTGIGDPERVKVASVAANFLKVVGMTVQRGRELGGLDEQAPVALVSESFWRRKFGNEPFANRSLRLSDASIEVVGVVADCCSYPERTDVWRVVSPTSAGAAAEIHFLTVVVRVASPSTTPARLEHFLTDANSNLSTQYASLKDFRVVVMPLRDQMLEDSGKVVGATFVGMTLLMLLACASIGHMLLARAISRRGELAVMVAIGAPFTRLLAHVCLDSIVLTTAAGIVGGITSVWTINLVRSLSGGELPVFAQPAFNLQVSMFTIVVCVLVAIAVAVPTAVNAFSSDAMRHVRNSGLNVVGRHESHLIQRLLLSVQFASAFVLLLGATLLAKSFVRLSTADIGYSTDGLMAVTVPLPSTRYSQARAARFFEELITDLKHAPGVKAVAASSSMPLSGGIARRRIAEVNASDLGDRVNQHLVTIGYFATLGVRLAEGRDFTVSDTNEQNKVAIVNRAFEARYLQGNSALGQTVRFDDALGKQTFTIVGVVPNFRDASLALHPGPQMYTTGLGLNRATVLVAANESFDGTVSQVRTLVRTKDPELVAAIQSVSSSADTTLASPQRRAVVSAIFALFAFAIATAGIVGMVLFLISERGREIAVRISCGAPTASLVRVLVTGVLCWALVGVCGGGVAGFILTDALQSLLYEVPPFDITAFVGVAAFLLGSGAIAALAGAIRVASIQPQQLLTTAGQ